MLAEEWDRSPDDARLSRRRQDALRHGRRHRPARRSSPSTSRAATCATLVAERHRPRAPAGGRPHRLRPRHLRAPAELHTVAARRLGARASSPASTASELAAVRLGEPEQFSFKGAGGDTVHGWLVKPVDFEPGKKYPVAFLIHGGPQGSFGNDFHYRWNPQVYAGAGYAAVMIDFHGSTGYGQAFTDAIRSDWGGKPLEDLQKGLDRGARSATPGSTATASAPSAPPTAAT